MAKHTPGEMEAALLAAKPDVPGWLAQLGQDEAQKLCAFYARQCLADATTARCNGHGRRPADPQDSGSWYAAARRWLALRSALGVGGTDGR